MGAVSICTAAFCSTACADVMSVIKTIATLIRRVSFSTISEVFKDFTDWQMPRNQMKLLHRAICKSMYAFQ